MPAADLFPTNQRDCWTLKGRERSVDRGLVRSVSAEDESRDWLPIAQLKTNIDGANG